MGEWPIHIESYAKIIQACNAILAGCCTVCGSSSRERGIVEVRPGVRKEAVCISCGCFPREQLIWSVIERVAAEHHGGNTCVVEIGGRARFADRMRRLTKYLNCDVKKFDTEVNCLVRDGIIADVSSGIADVCILSFVLSAIPTNAERVVLLSELSRVSSDDAVLIVCDDCDLSVSDSHSLSEVDYFHRVRFGRDILDLLWHSGWYAQVVDCKLQVDRDFLDLPLFLCVKKG